MDHKEVEDAVLSVYRRVSPSFKDVSSAEKFNMVQASRTAICRELGLTPASFKGKKVIEIGGGTGENSIIYALWGADVTIIDPNEISCQRASALFHSHGRSLTVINESLFDTDLGILNDFDIVIAEGVLHHTFDPKYALSLILSNLKKGALALVAICEENGWLKRNLQRSIVRTLGGDTEGMYRVARDLFADHLNRSMKFGGRSEASIIEDTFVNPQIQVTSLKDLCGVCLEHDMIYVSAYPSLTPFMTTSPWSQARENKFNYDFYKEYYHFLEKMWAVSGEEVYPDAFNIAQLVKRVEAEYGELLALMKEIEADEINLNNIKIIQKGYMGIGMWYFLGEKHESVNF